jgi:hypothetical protein
MRCSSGVIIQGVSFLASLRDLPADAGFVCNEAPSSGGTIKEISYVSWKARPRFVCGSLVARYYALCVNWSTRQFINTDTLTCHLKSYFQYKNRHVCLSVCLCYDPADSAPHDRQVPTPYQPAGIQNRNNVKFQVFWDVTLYLWANTSRRTWPGSPPSIPTGTEQLPKHYFPFLLNSRRQKLRTNWVIPRDPPLSKQLNPFLT